MKKILLATAGATTMFALTAAGAASLPLAGPGSTSYSKHVVQQSDEVTASCTNGTVETAYTVQDDKVNELLVLQQYIGDCVGSQFQAVLYNAAGEKVATSDVVRYTQQGRDARLSFGQRPDAQEVDSMRLTIADNIVAGAGANPARIIARIIA